MGNVQELLALGSEPFPFAKAAWVPFGKNGEETRGNQPFLFRRGLFRLDIDWMMTYRLQVHQVVSFATWEMGLSSTESRKSPPTS